MQYKMKDSGVEWIGNIPQYWKKCRLKSVLRILRGSSPRPIEEYLTDSGDGINWIKIGDTDKGQKSISQTKQKIKPSGVAKSRLVRKGDLLLTNSMSFGEPYFLEIDGCIHDGWVCFTNLTNINKLFLYYFLCSEFCRIQFQLQVAGGVVQNLNIDKIGETILYLPLAKEQSAIADYLDQKCGAIDEIIEQAKATIEEYKAWKSSVIFEAVTKGLDPNVEMKDSGVDIIGLMPKHWNLIKVKFCTSKIGSGKTPRGGAEIYTDSGIMLLRSQNIYSTGLVLDNVSYISEKIDEEMANTRVFADDILLNITGGSIGRCCIYPSNLPYANVNQHVCIIRVISQIILPKLMLYIWMSNVGQKSIDIFQTGANRESMNFEQIGNTFIPIMDYQEQKKIVQYLDEKCATIDGIIAEKEALIADMEAYKKSLIFETVTGKRKVY